MPNAFSDWIAPLPRRQGWLQLSAERAYAHAEEQYDTQYGVQAAEPEEGEGLCNLLKTHAVDTAGPALEIGCGTGRLTYGLARHYPGPDFLITDPSPAFLRITQEQFGDGTGFPPRLHFGVLNADDLGQLPADMFSVIAMRSTLHHILDPEAFITQCARTLRPRGALIMSCEPCESGYILMGAVGQSIIPVLRNAGVELKPAWEKQIQDFTDTIKFYCRRDLNKKRAEDKHLFRVHELSELGHRLGLHLRYFPNAAYSDFAPPYLPEFEGFTHFLLEYLQYCMMFDAELLAHIRRHLQPQMKYIDDCYRSHVGPTINGVYLLQKAARP